MHHHVQQELVHEMSLILTMRVPTQMKQATLTAHWLCRKQQWQLK
jgi:hypothetical protein